MRLRRQGEKDTLAELDKFREMQDQVDQQRRRRLEEMSVRTNERGLQERPRQETAQREEIMRVSDGPRMAEPEKMAPPADENEETEPIALDAGRRNAKVRTEVIPGTRSAWWRNWTQLRVPIFSRQFGQVHVDWMPQATLIRTGAGWAVTDDHQVVAVRFIDRQGTLELSGPYGNENDPALRLPEIQGVVDVEDELRSTARDAERSSAHTVGEVNLGELLSLTDSELEEIRTSGTLRGRPVTVTGLETRPAAAAVLKSRAVVVPVARETRTAPPLEQVQLPELEDPASTWASLSELHRRTVIEEVTRSKADGVRAWRERWDRLLPAFQVRLLQSAHFDAHRRGENPRPRADIVREEEMRRTWNQLSDEERSDLIRRAAPRAFSSSEVFAALGSWDALKAVAGLDGIERRILEVVISRLERDGTIIIEGGTEPEEPERFDVYDRDKNETRS